MMAHEVPLQVRPTSGPSEKTNKHRPLREAKLLLPNGDKPDFGDSHKLPQRLPNGEKPDFGGESKKKGRKPKKEPKKEKDVKVKEMKVKDIKVRDLKVKDSKKEAKPKDVKKDCYAGSSFHSSPEAVALPKPSFAAASPKPIPAAAAPQPSPNYSPASFVKSPPQASPLQPNMAVPQQNYAPNIHFNPAVMYQGVPPMGPPRHPVTFAPGASPPGFEYFARQGYINYHYPPQPQFAPQPYPQHNPGQKISFNDLMGSSK